MTMDKFLEQWINETIGDEDIAGEIPTISLSSILFAAIANYRAPAWIQSPLRNL
tara:strand:+ start:20994 stop:21155 length:162 start_codon:yes stop_codon:yes gene_type:complete